LPAWTDVAHTIDRVTAITLIVVWVFPHSLLIVSERLGLFRRSWRSVYRSQSIDNSPTFTSSHASDTVDVNE